MNQLHSVPSRFCVDPGGQFGGEVPHFDGVGRSSNVILQGLLMYINSKAQYPSVYCAFENKPMRPSC